MGHLRHLFSSLKTHHKTKKEVSQPSSPSSLSTSSSAASLSSTSSSGPQTPTSFYFNELEMRGIFRTLEAHWAFYNSQSQTWIPLDMNCAAIIETHYQNQKPYVYLATCPFLGGQSCTVHFSTPARSKTCSKIDQMVSYQHRQRSSPTLPTTQQSRAKHTGGGLQLYLNRDILRTLVPTWWYEQDLMDGSKGMCRFEPRNQVRLEALSDDRTRLSLTDAGFYDASVTVVLNSPSLKSQKSKQRQQQSDADDDDNEEEMKGMLYVHSPSSSMMMMQSLGQKLEQVQPYENDYYYDTTTLQRRCSI